MYVRSRMRGFALIAACLGLTGCAGAAEAAITPRERASASIPCNGDTLTGGTHAIRSGGVTRSFFLHIPAGEDLPAQLPLILAFHGRGSSGRAMAGYSDLSSLPAIVAYPNAKSVGGKTAWQGAPYSPKVDDVAFASDLITYLQKHLCVDASRVFAIGKSNGGGFTALLACTLQSRIAAFAMVSGAFYPETSTGCASHSPVPILEFHGTADPVIDYAGGASHGQRYPSISDWLSGWAATDGCSVAPTQTAIGTDVVRLTWTGLRRRVRCCSLPHRRRWPHLAGCFGSQWPRRHDPNHLRIIRLLAVLP